jgi:hypothetical protein
VDDDEVAMLLDMAADRIAAGRVDDLLQDLRESGMADAVWDDARAWTALLNLQGRHLAASPLIDLVALHGLPDPRRALVLPLPGRSAAPARTDGRDLRVDGVAFRAAGAAGFAVGCDDGRVTEVAAGQLTASAVAGLDRDLGLQRITGSIPVRLAPPLTPDGWAVIAATASRCLAHELLGVAEGALDLAVSYVRDRRQFGRSIGSFQAVRHRLADAFIQVAGARAALEAARVQAPAAPGDIVEKALAGAAALTTMRATQQVTGAMGFTWEFGLHRFVRRAYVLDSILGGSEDAEYRVGALRPGELRAVLAPAALG